MGAIRHTGLVDLEGGKEGGEGRREGEGEEGGRREGEGEEGMLQLHATLVHSIK